MSDRFLRLAMESDAAARRGERELPRRPVALGPMDPADIVEPGDEATPDGVVAASLAGGGAEFARQPR